MKPGTISSLARRTWSKDDMVWWRVIRKNDVWPDRWMVGLREGLREGRVEEEGEREGGRERERERRERGRGTLACAVMRVG